MRQHPPFQRLVIIYPGGHTGSCEYDDIKGADIEILSDFPPTEWWPSVKQQAKKTLCIVDDFELKDLSKDNRSRLDRLTGHVSTHRNVSLCLCSQNFFNIPTIARRCASLFVVWKGRDNRSIDTMSQRIGHNLRELFALLPGEHDSLWVDLSPRSPAPLRINGYTLIHEKQDSQNTPVSKKRKNRHHETSTSQGPPRSRVLLQAQRHGEGNIPGATRRRKR